ncbi:GNAT family N-acyltransferase [Sporomusa sp.]|uniref:GNAT family N-acyltransferase n=1 Tax=Sporomusa sp. TaxID=2078658 RepID=UPI002C2BEFCE|nr:GNAT family N-acyltransferase [Sporomusa sp.]HWR45916.1 GNAT family N-acyltransferase [Sporomusa sp.]
MNRQDSIQISIARNQWEKDMVYRLRYGVYVEEMGKSISSAHHVSQQIYDEMDEFSIILYATQESTLIGTLRLTVGNIDVYPKSLLKKRVIWTVPVHSREINHHNVFI